MTTGEPAPDVAEHPEPGGVTERTEPDDGRRLTRRRFLEGTGLTALGALYLHKLSGSSTSSGPTAAQAGVAQAGVADASAPRRVPHGVALRGIEQTNDDRSREGRFGLMFKRLEPFRPADALLVGLAAGMVDTSTGAATHLDNPDVPAGYTFLGQFLDHDITLDTTPLDEQERDPKALRTFRTPRYDLDSVYGGGPRAQPHLYDPADPRKLRIGGGDRQPEDVPRAPDGTAVIPEARNDENLIIAQIQLSFLKFHNRLVDHVDEVSRGGFDEAQNLARWHWQWVVVHDFLPRIVGQEMLASVLDEAPGRAPKVDLRYYKPKNRTRPMLPLEHTAAAYRFGHSMVRGRYRLNAGPVVSIFGPEAGLDNLNGGRPLPEGLVIDWKTFYDDSGGQAAAQRARRIDTVISAALFDLPAPPPPDTLRSLAERNLLRGSRVGLPSGQAVARAMGVTPLTNEELGMPPDRGWSGQAPLWYYVLKEAELQTGGLRLGAVGGRIVAEVLVGLLAFDPTSYLSRNPGFRPEAPIAPEPGRFGMGDLLAFAGGY